MRRTATLALVGALSLGCRARVDTPSPTAPAPAVDHGPPPPYAGTWIGPALSLNFVGPWVLVRPRDATPDQAPIELRATVERREGDAFALRASVATVLPADFLRPSDWTMLVEDGQLAIAMGDEPLAAYLHDPAAEAPLIGPAMLDALALPEQISIDDGAACLAQASSRCAALEGEGPLAAGCRELQWGCCAAELHAAQGTDLTDPTVRAAWIHARRLHEHALTLRFADGLRQAADASQAGPAQALYVRALERVAALLDELARDGPLPDDPELPGLLAALEAGRAAGLLR